MLIHQTIRSMRDGVQLCMEPIALVPTMGYLHAGHMALVERAAELAPQVVVSIFVNPMQFGPNEDYARYPRDMERDYAMLREAGASHVFAPEPGEIILRDSTIRVDPGPMGVVLCGASRPGHFAGVCTIVLKLFNVVRPQFAVFGWKDAQQLLIIDRMVHELNVPVEIVGVETVREPDGLAMSSRNTYLSEEERKAAPAIYAALGRIRDAVRADANISTESLQQMFRDELAAYPAMRIDYIAVVNRETLAPLDTALPGQTLIATAVYLGRTRLIDNMRI